RAGPGPSPGAEPWRAVRQGPAAPAPKPHGGRLRCPTGGRREEPRGPAGTPHPTPGPDGIAPPPGASPRPADADPPLGRPPGRNGLLDVGRVVPDAGRRPDGRGAEALSGRGAGRFVRDGGRRRRSRPPGRRPRGPAPCDGGPPP